MTFARATVGTMKGTWKAPLQDRPQFGTKIQELHDLFLEMPAIPVAYSVLKLRFCWCSQQRNWCVYREFLAGYGLDIRRHSKGYWWCVAYRDRDFMVERA